MDLVADAAEVVGAEADVVADVRLNVQVADRQGGLLGGALDLVLVTGAVDDRLVAEQSESDGKHRTWPRRGHTHSD